MGQLPSQVTSLNPLIGAGIEAGGSLISGVASALTAKANTDWQEQQARLQRQWSSMPEQVARARMSGLNPNLVFGKGTGASTAPSVPSAPAMPTYPIPFAGLGNLALGKETLETDKPVKDSTVAVNTEEAKLKNRMIAYQEFTNILQESRSLYSKDLAAGEVNKLNNEVADLAAQCFMHTNQGHLAAAQEDREKIDKLLHNEQYNALHEQRPKLLEQLDAMIDNLHARSSESRASATEHYAGAADKYASADEHTAGAGLKRSQTEGQDIDNSYKPSQNEAEIYQKEASGDKSIHDSYKTGDSRVDVINQRPRQKLVDDYHSGYHTRHRQRARRQYTVSKSRRKR